MISAVDEYLASKPYQNAARRTLRVAEATTPYRVNVRKKKS